MLLFHFESKWLIHFLKFFIQRTDEFIWCSLFLFWLYMFLHDKEWSKFLKKLTSKGKKKNSSKVQ